MDLGPVLSPVRELGEYIREQRTAAQISLRALAQKAGVSNPYLSQVERGLRRPSAGILTQIAQGLSISAESLLLRAGILAAGESTDVVAAIRADAALSERQKASLIEIYDAFRGAHSDRADAPVVAGAVPAAVERAGAVPAAVERAAAGKTTKQPRPATRSTSGTKGENTDVPTK